MSLLMNLEKSEKVCRNYYLPVFLLKRLDKFAKDEQMSKSGVIKIALIEFLEKEGIDLTEQEGEEK